MNTRQSQTCDIERLLEEVDASGLSSIRRIVSGILRLINDPKSTVADLKKLIDLDPPLAAEVLRTANSAYYSSGRRISEIEEAVIWIGFDEIKEIVLRLSVRPIFNDEGNTGPCSRTSLWRHCVTVATLAKMIYRKEFRARGENVYALGLLHDIGIVIEDQFRHTQFVRAARLARGRKTDLAGAEQQVLGFDHALLGSALAARWHFPEDFETSIGTHHELPGNSETDEASRMSLTLFLADQLTLQMDSDGLCGSAEFTGSEKSTGSAGSPGAGAERVARALGLDPVGLELIKDELVDKVKRLQKQGLV